ncbi:XRE family transcriptional regulator [bacterium]|nr:MAG: XRE family transcriptional regulator [bacterium]
MKSAPVRREELLQNLVEARQKARVSRARVARWAGLSRMTISRIESGQQPPTPHALRAYAQTCALDTNQLLLSWGIVPEEVLLRLQQNPHLVAIILSS